MRISPEHARRYSQHYSTAARISRASQWLDKVEAFATIMGAETILDYGSGPSGGLKGFSKFQVTEYDPGVPVLDSEPVVHDMVASIHVLEHVEGEECLHDTLEHIMSLASCGALVVVSCQASSKILHDGTAWHTFVRPAQWWRDTLSRLHFSPVSVREGMESKEFAALWYAR